MSEIIVDSFAGGGGASLGIEMALGRSPDIAINHDREALAMHAANHPDTLHLPHNVWKVDPTEVTKGRPVGLLWASPDCKHFSKAKGGKPVKRHIRDLAWVVVRWARQVRPRIIILENVEEFRDWGPILEDGRPCPERKGQTFRQWTGELQRLGYRVEWRELRACDYGAPTIRKRLFLIARRDGRPIIWPKPTHGAPNDVDVIAGIKKPWRTAAEIIDWSLPCHSIFLTREEARAIGVNRPLAENTMARIAKGLKRYVLDAKQPFIVRVDQTSGDAAHKGVHSVDEPVRTVTTAGGFAVAAPFVSYAQQGGAVRDPAEPLHTVTASRKDQNAIVSPFLARTAHGEVDRSGKRRGQGQHSIEEPIGTLTASRDHAIVAPHLMTMRNSGKPFNGADEPTHTVTAGGAGLSVVSPFLVPRYGERSGQEPRTRSVEEPAPVVVPTANGGSLAAVMLSRQFGASVGSGAEEPVGTVTAGGGGKTALVSAFLAQHNDGPRPGQPGRMPTEPLSTVTATGSQQAVVSAGLVSLKGSDRRASAVEEPARTVLAGGWHAAEVRAFLTKYYGSDQDPRLDEPLHTATTKDRFSLVTVDIEGEPYVIADIGMRMLSPRELFRAQGFGDHYEIERGQDVVTGEPIALTKTAQIRMCGNSVSPVMAEALAGANYRPDEAQVPRRRRAEPEMPLLIAAE